MRAGGVCAEPGCPRLAVRRGRCEVHTPPPWTGQAERRRNAGAPTGAARQRLRLLVLVRADGRCESCGVRLGADWTMDHVDPVAFGGSSHLDNLAAICPRCHARKTQREAALGRARARSRSLPPNAERQGLG